ncbi:hypothetical protein Q8A67_023500 [Cirrhinus molitorella]|uniref:Uncharacterized protein n=1 Tax=Cirrhinus molitorella TaxID=172907 RepID=A0AA88P667_9TELE|nr:hypothetical protein Q8A67_023500 [Cirrhinus molitorella]
MTKQLTLPLELSTVNLCSLQRLDLSGNSLQTYTAGPFLFNDTSGGKLAQYIAQNVLKFTFGIHSDLEL